jgi:hypothetical protein
MAILPPAMSASGAQLMVKILMGLAAVVVIAVGGFFGFELYTQHRVTGDVETAFEQIRAGGGKASHGKVSFDLKSRTVRIADIATESASQPPVSRTQADSRPTASNCRTWKSAPTSSGRQGAAVPTRCHGCC